MTTADRFSTSWLQARDRFRIAAAAHPHHVDSGALEVVDGLTIDWAWTGARAAKQVLVFSSGLHGIEGYAGCAAQLEMIAAGAPTPTLWLHALNPWGMKHWRRVNEANVDLNRGFLPPGTPWSGDDRDYNKLDDLLNPKRPPGFELFWPRLVALLARHGLPTLRNVVARGQYSHPQGVFFCGEAPQPTAEIVVDLVERELAGRERVVWIDLHTARGPRGQYVAFLDGEPETEQTTRAKNIFGDALRAWVAGSEDGYDMRGGMLREIGRRLSGVRYDGLTVEFGTVSDIAIIRAMRIENQLFFHGPEELRGPRVDLAHAARRAMQAAFCPDDPHWRQHVLTASGRILDQARELIAAP